MKAVGYIRVSTEEQRRDGWNLDADRDRIAQIAAENGWDLVAVHDDGGRQGDDPDRPGFNALLDGLAETDVILLRSLDRLSRDTYLYALAAKAIREAGVRVETFTGPVDLDSPEGELSTNVLAAIARFEKRQIGVRVKQAMRARAEAGHHHGRAPFGYGPHMDVIESEAAIIRAIFRWYAEEGVSQLEISRRLNGDGVAAQRGTWSQGSISKTLGLPAYIGKVRFHGQVLDGDHEPIVPLDLWEKAQALRATRGRAKRGKDTRGAHLLGGGMLRCGRCGGGMYATTRVRPGRQTIEVYHCSTRHRNGLDACDQPTVKRRVIDEAVWRLITESALDLESSQAAIIEQRGARLTDAGTLLAEAQREAVRLDARQAKIDRDYFDGGELTAATYERLNARLAEDRAATDAEVERLSQRVVDLSEEADDGAVHAAVLAEVAALRTAILSDAREGANAGVPAFRAALRRLFVSFELVTFPSFGAAPPEGMIWPQDRPVAVESGCVLIPRIHREAFDPARASGMRPMALTEAFASYANNPPPESRPTNTPRPPSPPAARNG